MTGRKIEIVEVGPRDGLQNESVLLSTAQKVEFIRRAIDAGVRRMEVTSFVHPKLVPQMADAEDVAKALPKRDDFIAIGLVLNKRGALRALDIGIDEIGAVCAASDSFGQRNQGMTSKQSLDVCCDIAQLARSEGRRVQVTIAVAFGCPFEGEVSHDRVVAMARRAAEAGALEIAIADTIGVAGPLEVDTLVRKVREAVAPLPVRAHFHNTRNTGLANVWAAVTAGVTTIDSSIGGIGGCPFAPRATGNVPTEDVVYMLERCGVQTGLDLSSLIGSTEWLTDAMGRTLPGMVSRAGSFPPARKAA